MKYGMVVLLAVLLGGCATAKPTFGPDGGRAYTIDCSGTAGSWGMCEGKAGDLCGAAGYTVVSQSGDKGVIASPAILTSTISRTMLIECKKA